MESLAPPKAMPGKKRQGPKGGSSAASAASSPSQGAEGQLGSLASLVKAELVEEEAAAKEPSDSEKP